jgi:hypothetical protein
LSICLLVFVVSVAYFAYNIHFDVPFTFFIEMCVAADGSRDPRPLTGFNYLTMRNVNILFF